MAIRKIWSVVSRLVVVAVLAVTLVAGSVAVGHPADAAAAKYTCAQAYALGQAWMNYGDIMYANGNYTAAANAYGKAVAYFDFC
jgi:tetratricopeptide (TPR) repeat protein